MRHLTIRNIPEEVSAALEREKVRRQESLNQTIIELLRDSLGVTRGERRNGLAALAGTWTEEEHARFEQAVAVNEQIDEELWRPR
jgi:plasmid stability protein